MARMIVRRGDLERYDVLYKTFGSRILVTWDRRRSDRRKLVDHPSEPERRVRERRGPAPVSWSALGFLVAE